MLYQKPSIQPVLEQRGNIFKTGMMAHDICEAFVVCKGKTSKKQISKGNP